MSSDTIELLSLFVAAGSLMVSIGALYYTREQFKIARAQHLQGSPVPKNRQLKEIFGSMVSIAGLLIMIGAGIHYYQQVRSRIASKPSTQQVVLDKTSPPPGGRNKQETNPPALPPEPTPRSPSEPIIPSTWVSRPGDPQAARGTVFVYANGEASWTDAELGHRLGQWKRAGSVLQLSFGQLCAFAVFNGSPVAGINYLSLSAFPLQCRSQIPCSCFDGNNAINHDRYWNREFQEGDPGGPAAAAKSAELAAPPPSERTPN